MKELFYFWAGTVIAVCLRFFMNKFDYWDIAYCGLVGLMSIGIFFLNNNEDKK